MVSATPGQSRAGQAPQRSLEEIAKELENPMSTTWSLVFQDNLNLLQGDAVEGTQVGNTFLFQPALPIPMGRRAVLIARPVFPIVSLPELDAASPGGVKGRQTGFGDMQVLALLGTTTPKGLVYAAGVTTIFPTASNENLGGGKYQAAPQSPSPRLGQSWYTASPRSTGGPLPGTTRGGISSRPTSDISSRRPCRRPGA